MQSAAPKGKCWFDELPNEVLSEIFIYARIQKPREWMRHVIQKEGKWILDPDYHPIIALSRVCKRWRTIYEMVSMQSLYCSNLEETQKFLQSFRTGPYRASYPQSADIRLCHPIRSMANNATSILQLCTVLQSVTLSMGRDYWDETAESSSNTIDNLEPLFQAIRALPRLKTLTLSEHSRDKLTIKNLLDFFAIPSLQQLHIENSPTRYVEENVDQRDLELLLPPDRYRTSGLLSLKLELKVLRPHVLKHILRCPTGLVKFSYRYLAKYDLGLKCYGHSSEDLRRSLNLHRHSLRYIRLGMNMDVSSGMIDFSGFPCLEELDMLPYPVMGCASPSDAAKKLNAPNLRCLTLNFSRQLPPGKDHMRWITDFALIRKTHYPRSKLEKVSVDSSSWSGRQELVTISGDERRRGWAWIYFTTAEELTARYGLELELRNIGTKEEWDRYMTDEPESELQYNFLANEEEGPYSLPKLHMVKLD
ncbi:hypothetical protein F5884DRAFT_749518 [Xylogone sp. PMI_703]|nr:hypothetical protein F5884DRAFT_749518 [Xylogone sp. PMI_703]